MATKYSETPRRHRGRGTRGTGDAFDNTAMNPANGAHDVKSRIGVPVVIAARVEAATAGSDTQVVELLAGETGRSSFMLGNAFIVRGAANTAGDTLQLGKRNTAGTFTAFSGAATALEGTVGDLVTLARTTNPSNVACAFGPTDDVVVQIVQAAGSHSTKVFVYVELIPCGDA